MRHSADNLTHREIRCPRRGVTLVEMVVVVFIFTILAAIAVPQVRLAIEDRRVREATRALTVALGSARNQAMATGRPAGVILRRFTEGQSPNACTEIEQTEGLAPYAGDTIASRARISYTGYDGTARRHQFTVAFTDPIQASAASHGDRIQFNNQGPWYHVYGTPTTGQLTCSLTNTDVAAGLMWPWPDAPDQSVPVPYLIKRRPRSTANDPILGSANPPIQLPDRAAVDLSSSGVGPTGVEFHSSTAGNVPVVIMFSPDGSLEYITTGSGGASGRPTQPVYFLVGELERVPSPDNPAGLADDGKLNIQRFGSFWVSVHPRTGLTTTVELAAEGDVQQSRQFAFEGQSMGGG